MRDLSYWRAALAWTVEMKEQVSHSRHAWHRQAKQETREQAGAKQARQAPV
jgi:hypothetical protein